MKIGELAQASQCTVETIRFYEKEGLLPAPERTQGNFRLYGSSHLQRLRFVRNCRALDMSHEEIHGLLNLVGQPFENCSAVNAVFDQHIMHVDERIAELVSLKEQLSALREQCQTANTVDACGILQGLGNMQTKPQSKRQSHLG